MAKHSNLTVGQATIELLAQYGVDTVFGIPGVHTLEFCRGLNASAIRHVQVRNEQGAGFMADGYARSSGKPGVALVISGPGVTNALTAVGQAYADSVPLLLLSSEADSASLGKGWGMLHEVVNLTDATAPVTTLSATARTAQDVPELIAQAFTLFASERPRPVHIAIPTDVLELPVEQPWLAVNLPSRAGPDPKAIAAACELLKAARQPMICVGGGARDSGDGILRIAQQLGAPVISSIAGKGIVDDSHPLALAGGRARSEVQAYLNQADVILAIGTELAETDSFAGPLNFNGQLIRVDLDARKMNDLYPAALAIVSDAGLAANALANALGESHPRQQTSAEVAAIKISITSSAAGSEKKHRRALTLMRECFAANTIIMGDACQLVYTGAYAFDVAAPRLWNYPVGYCTLGSALPAAIGAKLAMPNSPVVCFAGDGGFMFTVQELVTGAELKLPIPIILWNNEGLKQIQDDMIARDIALVGVEGKNPDFIALATACGCAAIKVDSATGLTAAIAQAFNSDRPTLIEINENDSWLSN